VIPADVRLFTWLDVEDVLRRALDNGVPEWFVDARAYWDGLRVRTKPDRTEHAERWLRGMFEPRAAEPQHALFESLRIRLESANGQRTLPVMVEETSDEPDPVRQRPTFARPHLLREGVGKPLHPPPLPAGSPDIIAFHSFKGGVGRTLHALALAQRYADQKRPVLLIDADFEAPGISWLVDKALPAPPISFADLLALVHGDGGESVALAASRMRDSVVDGIHVMPSFREADKWRSLEVKPEHLARSQGDSFPLVGCVAALGRELGVEAVVVDLRAGLSELAAGFLLDPRVTRVFVTTLGGQALKGTEAVIDLVRSRAPSTDESHPNPMVILNQVPPDSTELVANAEERLLRVLAQFVGKDDLVAEDVLRGRSLFDPALLVPPDSWADLMSSLRRGTIGATVGPIMGPAPSRPEETGDALNERRRALDAIASRLVYADSAGVDEFLPIVPLTNMVERHRSHVPIAVVVGAKGAGKTFTCLQLARRKQWKDFSAVVLPGVEVHDAAICPVLAPQNLSEATRKVVDAARSSASLQLGGGAPMDSQESKDRVRAWLKDDADESDWRERWLDLISWTAGIRPSEEGAGRSLPEHLARAGTRLLAVFDGLEELFAEVATSERQRTALRSLLLDVPNWLEQQPERALGAIIFVRRDLVGTAILQNTGQFLNKYGPYALKWDKQEALRLVAWISAGSVVPGLNPAEVRSMDEAALVEGLAPLWGRKLGADKSRQGRSNEWIIAALSDFNNQVQARDLVRLLQHSAENSIGSPWTDRVLAPGAIRAAVDNCSSGKVEEISQENAELKSVFSRLKDLPDSQRSNPLKRESLESNDLDALKRNALLVEDGGDYYLAEIVRRGLNFRVDSGKQPRVMSLRRRRPSS
jgi:MinD-like ATPase involved in chromosome partitioning or flagellar assembly